VKKGCGRLPLLGSGVRKAKRERKERRGPGLQRKAKQLACCLILLEGEKEKKGIPGPACKISSSLVSFCSAGAGSMKDQKKKNPNAEPKIRKRKKENARSKLAIFNLNFKTPEKGKKKKKRKGGNGLSSQGEKKGRCDWVVLDHAHALGQTA